MIENIKGFIEGLGTNEKALELLKAAGLGDSEEDASILARVAREVGYEVGDDEMREFLAEMQRQRAAESDAVADQIRELSTEELDAVAGGAGAGCHDTFQLDENCALIDNCRQVFVVYTDENDNCASYAYCDGLATKPDCTFGRLGW